jgi:hypothetical protein
MTVIVYLSELINTEFDGLVVRNIITQKTCFNVSGYWVSGSMRNCIFDNIHSTFNITAWDAITLFNVWVTDTLTVENCKFSNFTVMNDQVTFHISNTDPNNAPVHININNCLFDNLRTGSNPIYFQNGDTSDFRISNCILVNSIGAQAAVSMCGKVSMQNNIFNNPTCVSEIYMQSTSGYNTHFNFDYNNIRN